MIGEEWASWVRIVPSVAGALWTVLIQPAAATDGPDEAEPAYKDLVAGWRLIHAATAPFLLLSPSLPLACNP